MTANGGGRQTGGSRFGSAEMTQRALVLGAYGLIGAACVRALQGVGFQVSGMGRSPAAARLSGLEIDWHLADMTRVSASDWRRILSGVDVVVNAACALQDGGGDSLERIHMDLVRNLTTGAVGLPVRIVQISAAGVTPEASTEFFRSNARGDALLAQSGVDHVILRPTLVLAREAYGGTALLRAAAALPVLQPRLFPETPVQTVALDNVAAAVVCAAQGQVPNGTIADLTERPFTALPG